MRGPWFRKQTGCWYWTTPAGKQINLGEEKDAAFDLWHRYAAGAFDLGGDGLLLVHLLDSFLTHVEATQSRRTYEWYLHHLKRVSKAIGAVRVSELRPYHLTTWLDKNVAAKGTRKAIIRSVKTALNWADEQGIIEVNRLAKLKAPRDGKREITIPEDVHRRAVAGAHKRMRLLLALLWLTGMRPEEARELTASQYRERTGQVVIPRGKGERPRVVRLSACARTIVRILAWKRPTGPLLLSQVGRRPLSINSIVHFFASLRKKGLLPAGVTAYVYRHTYITDALERGISTAAVAELAGHRDATMIAKHYGHLEQREGMLNKVAEWVRSTSGGPSDQTPGVEAGASPWGSLTPADASAPERDRAVPSAPASPLARTT